MIYFDHAVYPFTGSTLGSQEFYNERVLIAEGAIPCTKGDIQ